MNKWPLLKGDIDGNPLTSFEHAWLTCKYQQLDRLVKEGIGLIAYELSHRGLIDKVRSVNQEHYQRIHNKDDPYVQTITDEVIVAQRQTVKIALSEFCRVMAEEIAALEETSSAENPDLNQLIRYCQILEFENPDQRYDHNPYRLSLNPPKLTELERVPIWRQQLIRIQNIEFIKEYQNLTTACMSNQRGRELIKALIDDF